LEREKENYELLTFYRPQSPYISIFYEKPPFVNKLKVTLTSYLHYL
jgi:hypothetical protein